jgi:predicted phosphodiesterase
MRVHAVSDLHLDYEVNQQWLAQLSASDYTDDVLILAGDVSDSLQRLRWGLDTVVRRFRQVLYVPGNHELWVLRDEPGLGSFDKFDAVQALAADCGASTRPWTSGGLTVVPLLSWYDHSFGRPGPALQGWTDYRACRWPPGFTPVEVCAHFLRLNEPQLALRNQTLISFSHFLPRIDLMPPYIPPDKQVLYPVLGSVGLEQQLRRLLPDIHVYGHSHVNRRLGIEGITYVNNAFGYPNETRIAAKRLLCIHEG